MTLRSLAPINTFPLPIKDLLETPPKMVQDPSGQCSLRIMCTKQMFVLVSMQLCNQGRP